MKIVSQVHSSPTHAIAPQIVASRCEKIESRANRRATHFLGTGRHGAWSDCAQTGRSSVGHGYPPERSVPRGYPCAAASARFKRSQHRE